VDNIKFHTALPTAEQGLQKSDGAIGELVSLFDELSANPAGVRALADEFSDIAKKIPKELRGEAGGLKFDDFDWLSEILSQARPLLLQRLMRQGAGR
jgi:exonuclease SbcD